MKLLFDENLSDRIVSEVLNLYPGSTHVKSHGLIQTSDTLIWSFAQQHGYTIASKDADFHQRSLVFGHPPKLVFLRIGNGPTSHIAQLLRTYYVQISEFNANPNTSILVLT